MFDIPKVLCHCLCEASAAEDEQLNSRVSFGQRCKMLNEVFCLSLRAFIQAIDDNVSAFRERNSFFQKLAKLYKRWRRDLLKAVLQPLFDFFGKTCCIESLSDDGANDSAGLQRLLIVKSVEEECFENIGTRYCS